MKSIIYFTLLLMTTPSLALEFYSINTNQAINARELARACTKDQEDAQKKLDTIAQRLQIAEGSLHVSAKYGVLSHRTGSIRFPSYSYQSYCLLNFQSKDPATEFREETPVRFIRLGRSNWESACEPAYQASINNPDSPISILWTAWTLVQGRMCEVQTVVVAKKVVSQ